MRSAGDASRDNWRDRMLMWRLGPFARSAEDKEFFTAQQDWCEQIHKEGIDGFFSDPEWETPKGMLAKLIVLDQFPRSVYRGTPAAYANDPVTVRMAEHLCTTARDMTEYNLMERMWVYVPLSHAEELALQELCVEKYVTWSRDLVAAVFCASVGFRADSFAGRRTHAYGVCRSGRLRADDQCQSGPRDWSQAAFQQRCRP